MENFNMILLFLIAMGVVLAIAVIYNVKETGRAISELTSTQFGDKALYMVRDLTSEPMTYEVTKQHYEDQVRFAVETGMKFAVHRKNGNFIIDLLGE